MSKHSFNSSTREKLIEHLFIGELLRYAWLNGDVALEVSKPEVDNSGYDVIVEIKGVLRHIQLKSAFVGSKTARQNVHTSLSSKPSGCVVWIYFNPETLALGPFLYFGSKPGEAMPDLNHKQVVKHTKGNSEGFKAERQNIRIINKGDFEKYDSIELLYAVLFDQRDSIK